MIKVNAKFKAVGEEVDLSAGGVNLAETQARVQEALADINKYREENAENMTEEQLHDMERIETMLKAESAAIAAYGAGGAGGGGGNINEEDFARPQSLMPLWNGGTPQISETDRQKIADDQVKYGEYVSTINIPKSPDPAKPRKIAFQMEDGMSELYAETLGRDIVLTAVYQDGSRRSWIVKEGTMRQEPIILSAQGLTHGVKIDTRGVFRITPGGQASDSMGFYIHGTEYDDEIYGTQVRDKIAGYAGNDQIVGMAGDDVIWGNENDDDLRGGAGNDILYGGDGIETFYTSDKGEAINEAENEVSDEVEDLPDQEDIFTSNADWEWAGDGEDGMMVIRNKSGKAGELDIDMPDGYNMAYAEQKGLSLIITFVGDEGTFKLKVENFFDEFVDESPTNRVVRMNFRGNDSNNIIDFSRIVITSQVINLDGGDGVDTILGARNALLANGVDIEDLKRSQGSGNLNKYLEDGIFQPPLDRTNPYGASNDKKKFGGYEASVEGSQIVISADAAATNRDPILNLAAPDGYSKGYITEDADNFYVVMVKPAQSTEAAATIVVRVDKDLVGNKMTNILVQHKEAGAATSLNEVPLTPVSSVETDYLTSGGDGEDLIFTEPGQRVENEDDEDEVEEYPGTGQ